MITTKHKFWIAVATSIVALTSLNNFATAQSTSKSATEKPEFSDNMSTDKYESAATKHVNDALGVLRKMEAAPRMKTILQQAKGVFIVPSYGRAALVVGGRGGAGVLLVKRDDGSWSDPVFYNISGLSVGLQAGVEGGPIAMVLNNEKAIDRFMDRNNFSLSANTGITVVNWAKMAEGSTGPGDVVAWAGTKGLFGDVVTVGVNDIRLNQNLTNAYYARTLSAKDVISGKVKNAQADSLKQALSSLSTGTTSTGAGGTTGSTSKPEGGK